MMAHPGRLRREETQEALSAALVELLGAGARLRSWNEHPLSEHGKHPLVRYELRARAPGGGHDRRYDWVGKFYDRDVEARREASVLRRLAPTDRDDRAGLVIPQAVSYVAAHRLLVMTYESGESIVSAIAHGKPAVLDAIGRALAALHALPITHDAILSPAAALADLRHRVPELGARIPGEAGVLRRALEGLERQVPAGATPSAFLHGDLGPIHLLWNAGRVVVLDFEKSARGDPALDLGYLLAQLRRVSLRKPGKLPEFGALRGEILEAYRRWSPPDPGLPARVGWYEQATLLRKLHYLASDSTRRPQAEAIRQHRVEALCLLDQLPRVLELYAGPE